MNYFSFRKIACHALGNSAAQIHRLIGAHSVVGCQVVEKHAQSSSFISHQFDIAKNKGASLNTLSEIASILNVHVSFLFADYKSGGIIPSSETYIKCPKCGEKIIIKVE